LPILDGLKEKSLLEGFRRFDLALQSESAAVIGRPGTRGPEPAWKSNFGLAVVHNGFGFLTLLLSNEAAQFWVVWFGKTEG
jgi:hypothetical protein